MTELLSIYAINLIPLITSLYLVPNYKTTIIETIRVINKSISDIDMQTPRGDTYIREIKDKMNIDIYFPFFKLPAYPNNLPLSADSYKPYETRLYDLLNPRFKGYTTAASSKIFLFQFKTFLEKLIKLYEQVEERKAGGFKQFRSVKTRMRKSRKNNKSIKQRKYK
jgi:hypothetical protein